MMRKNLLVICSVIFLATTIHAQQIQYTNGNDSWNPDSLGNHRAVVVFNGDGKVAKAIVEWRRRDVDAQSKRVIVQDAQTQQKVLNVEVLNSNRETGEICFEPTSGKGIYYVYYMPYKNEGRSNYPRGRYLKPDTTSSAAWLASFSAADIKPNAFCSEIQSVNAMNSFYPMEVIATAAETQQLKDQYKKEAFLFFRKTGSIL